MKRDKAIKALVESLPEYSEVIARAFIESEQFSSMCSDFEICTNAIARWKNEGSAAAQTRREEYDELRNELRQEILGWLEARGYLGGSD